MKLEVGGVMISWRIVELKIACSACETSDSTSIGYKTIRCESSTNHALILSTRQYHNLPQGKLNCLVERVKPIQVLKKCFLDKSCSDINYHHNN